MLALDLNENPFPDYNLLNNYLKVSKILKNYNENLPKIFQNFPHIQYAHQYYCLAETDEDDDDSNSDWKWICSDDTCSINSSLELDEYNMEEEIPNVNDLLPLVSRYAQTLN